MAFRRTQPTQGLFGILFDGVLISTGIAGVRRVTGYNVYNSLVRPNVSNFPLRSAIKGYLNMGEFLIDKGIDAIEQRKEKKKENYFDKPDPRDRIDDQRSDRERFRH
mmetsp:Transcript_10632/g.15953  ORF Transcript_10632/g.15953 Transcript_10632/m.15953 type:complete len:107 (-) Transcript_10632:15-335(-)